MSTIVLIAHNLRSTHNVGSILRTADGLGVNTVYLTGYTPYPLDEHDTRMPHIAQKLHKAIHKTALGAEISQAWEHIEDVFSLLEQLHNDGYVIAALEQTDDSTDLATYVAPDKLAIIVGREVEGCEPEVLAASDLALEIPMVGQKESYNVSIAAAIALYHCTYIK